MRISASEYLSYLQENLQALENSVAPLWHPLGFVSCIIKELGDHVVRVHHWPKGERRVKNPDWPIHTHMYHLSSHVLEGRVRDLQYRKVPGDSYRSYRVKYRSGGSEIQRTAQMTDIELQLAADRFPGEEYSVAAGVFHQSEVPVNISATTLAVLSEFQRDNDPLVLGSSEGYRYPYDRTAYDRQRFWTEVRDTLRSYERSGMTGLG